MAVTLKSQFSVNIGTMVDQSVSAVKAVRSTERARKEAEFQKAIADGLSYEEQVSFRERQLEEEKKSSFSDSDYISTLEKSVTDTKKLSRFNRYRTKYANTLGELSAGKINEEQYLQTLQDTLTGVDDPELRLEIQNDITTAQAKVKQYHDTILDNQVKKAKYDGTQTALNSAIVAVKNARSTALINQNDDEVTAYDETLAALDSQLSTTKIQDSLTNFQVNSSTRGTSPIEKLNYINGEISNANPNQPIRIGDRTYDSAQQFWSLERDNYLNGNSQIFGKFFDELESETKNKVAANTAKFGYPTQTILDDANQTFRDLGGRAEIAPFAAKLEITKANAMADAVDKYAKKVTDAAETSLQFDYADSQLQAAGQKYGIDTSVYRTGLFQRVRGLEQSQLIPAGSTERMAAKLQVEIPEIKNIPPVTPTPGATPETPAATGAYTVKSGDTLSAIAKKANMTLDALLTLNPEFKANPNLIKPGQNVKLTAEPAVPAEPATPAPTPTEQPKAPTSTPGATPATPGATPVAPITPPKVEAPTPPATPTPTPVKSTYTGSSIVDYLKSTGGDSSFAARKKIAAEKGIQNYTGTADENTKLLNLLRG